jgi:DNA-binding SARP family transcriptional activator
MGRARRQLLDDLRTLRPGLAEAQRDVIAAQGRYQALQDSHGRLIDRLIDDLGRPGAVKTAASSSALPFRLETIEEIWLPRALSEAPQLKVRLLGRFEVEVEGRLVRDWRSRRARELFAYLVLNRDQDLSRHRLMGVFWPDHSEERAENNLSLTVLALRRLLDDGRTGASLVAYRSGCYALTASETWVDAEVFQQAVHLGAARQAGGDAADAIEALDRAIGLYQGDLLPGDLYAEWTQPYRQELQDDFADALRRRAELARLQGDYDHSIELNRRLLAIDPATEDAHRQLMLDFLATGQRSRAVTQMEACRRALKRHLGVSPSRETLAVFERVRSLT